MSDFEMMSLFTTLMRFEFLDLLLFLVLLLAFASAGARLHGKLSQSGTRFVAIIYCIGGLVMTFLAGILMGNASALSHRIADNVHAGDQALGWVLFVPLGGLPWVLAVIVPLLMLAGLVVAFGIYRRQIAAGAA